VSLTQHFDIDEFMCRCGCAPPPEVLQRIPPLARALEVLRAEVRAPVQVISGYRCAKHNAKVGGALNSRHTWGDAVDLQVTGWGGKDLRALVERLIAAKRMPNGGLGTYEKKALTLHYDLRGIAARWHH
jgi:uncharacterized protein YcbK (DUF882 family)